MGRDFKKLGIWNTAYELLLMIYERLDKFPENESKNIVDQLRRAATSIPLNIAEGAGAHSNKVFLNFLSYAYKSAKEVEVLLLLSTDVGYLKRDEFEVLSTKLEFLKASMYKFMISVEKEIKQGMNNFSYYKPGFSKRAQTY